MSRLTFIVPSLSQWGPTVSAGDEGRKTTVKSRTPRPADDQDAVVASTDDADAVEQHETMAHLGGGLVVDPLRSRDAGTPAGGGAPLTAPGPFTGPPSGLPSLGDSAAGPLSDGSTSGAAAGGSEPGRTEADRSDQADANTDQSVVREPGTGRNVTGRSPIVEDAPPASGFGSNGRGSGPGVKILTVQKVNEARERNIRALKSLVAFTLFVVFAVIAVLLIVNA